jgi:hypothetical protein
VVVVVNAARKSWQGGDYGLWVGGGGSFKQIYCSQVGAGCAAGVAVWSGMARCVLVSEGGCCGVVWCGGCIG